MVAYATTRRRRLTGEDKTAFLVNYIRLVSGLNRVIGEVLAWLALAMVLVCFTVVVQRYVFHYSVLALQDLYVWMNGAMFTGVAGFALLRQDHVRVDIFYRPATTRTKAIADLIGVKEKIVRTARHKENIRPVFKRVDSCAAEFASHTAYLYSTE